MSSTRMPGKVLAKHRESTMLEIMVSRIRLEPRIQQIIIATTTNPADDEIVSEAKRLGVDAFRGSEENVLERVLGACSTSKSKHIVGLTGDCPLIAPEVISGCIDDYIDKRPDYLSSALVRNLPDGMDCQVFPVASLERLQDYDLSDLDKEHVTLYLRKHPELFSLLNFDMHKSVHWPELALTLDEPEDLKLICEILDAFFPRKDFSLDEIISLLRANPELQNINKHVNRKGDS
ncbi:SpsF Spore coat polysaccharide biosynthesis protein F, CMP-KDO synthetase homolog [Candidatus Nanopelagicaceae bacterium]